MFPAGYMAKQVSAKPSQIVPAHIVDVCSLSGCISKHFCDYFTSWKHNGFGLFDDPEIIRAVATDASVSLNGTTLFYYEAYEQEFDGELWRPLSSGWDLKTNVLVPAKKQLRGFDVVTFSTGTAPECSPLSCNSLANELEVNTHCLFSTFEQAKTSLDQNKFTHSEPGPYRIFAVYSVPWT
jgi:hypothetical protein